MPKRPLSIDVRRPLLLKSNDLVLLTRDDGEIPAAVPGFGLFYRDTCYLEAYALRLHGTAAFRLMASDAAGIAAQMALSNIHLSTSDGRSIPDHKLALRRTFLLLDDEGPAFVDTITVHNYGDEAIVLPVSIELATSFESMFVLRGAPRGKRGRLLAPSSEGTALRFSYEGADEVRRTLLVDFSLSPTIRPRTTGQSIAHFELPLQPRASKDLVVTLRVDERAVGATPPTSARPPRSVEALREAQAAASKALLDGYVGVETPSRDVGEMLARSFSDLALLNVERKGYRFTAAGVPWFVGLFGRDSLLPTLQCLAYEPGLATHTLRALARFQGEKVDARTGEEPGKILHELRVGEMAHLAEVTQTPSYESVDATLLFLIATAKHVRWTGDLELFHALRPNVERALAWLERKTAESPAGYVTYDGVDGEGRPKNQSWRDSATGVLRADGSFPDPPLALVEVQGYAYQARLLLAPLFRRLGEGARADKLESDAHALQRRFLRDFWMEHEGCYCIAIERDGRQVASVTSNAAQVLWTAIATPEHARRIAARIFEPDMFSGWGIRTLSSRHPRFDPLAYQQGSIWWFDSSLIVSGLRTYGHDAEALRIVGATLDAARKFPVFRLPEFIAGIERLHGDAPPHTPRADPLQAWSAGAIPFMVSELLGLDADGFDGRLFVRRPRLPDGVERLTLHDVQVARSKVSLRFSRDGERVKTEVVAGGAGLEIVTS